MSRLISIVATLLAGLVGLFLSVCGGGFLVGTLYSVIRALIRSGKQGDWYSIVALLVFAAACAVAGILILWKCWVSIRALTKGAD